MKHEMKLATVENLVTGFCFGAGALLVVLALDTLSTVKTVNAVNLYQSGSSATLAAFENGVDRNAGTYSGTVTEGMSSPGQAN